MEVNTDEVRTTGNTYFPAVADEFKSLADAIVDCQIDDRKTRSALEYEISTFIGFIVSVAKRSSDYLEDCGEILAEMADEYDFVDGENANNIEHPSSGFDGA